MSTDLRVWQQQALDKYTQHKDPNFLLQATPGAGKTRFMAEITKQLLDVKDVSGVLVVVPTSALRTQVALAFHRDTGIQLDPDWRGDCPLVRDVYRGAVVTYQWIASGNAQILRTLISRQKTLVILDEVHHGSDERSWGKALREALTPATRLLLTSGTPFRTDGGQIPFVGYYPFAPTEANSKAGLKAAADFSYGYGDALRDGVVRSIFFNRHGGLMEWEDEEGQEQATFDEPLDDKGQSRRLRTALMSDGGHLGGLLEEAHTRLQELRENDPDAGGLVIAMDQAHARAIVERMRQELGVTPLVAISDDPAASTIIERFRKNSQPWLVAVRMVSEGVDIPRLRVCVFATNVVTDLFFRQAVGRIVRIEPDHDDPTGYMFIPDDVRLRGFAQEITMERELILRERETREQREGIGAGSLDMFFRPERSTSNPNGVIVDGMGIPQQELELADEIRKMSPQTTGITKEVAATLLRNAGIVLSGERPDVARVVQAPVSEPHHLRLQHLRQRNNEVVPRIREKFNLQFNHINQRLNQAVGISSLPKCDDAEKLEQRLQYALRWLKDSIQPPGGWNG